MSLISKPRFLVTGCSGFIGSSLCRSLLNSFDVIGVSRAQTRFPFPTITLTDLENGLAEKLLGEFSPTHLIHCAALAHQSLPWSRSNHEHVHYVNTILPLRLASLSLGLGIKRFLFISSIGVHGPSSPRLEPITELSPFCPASVYTKSKLDAEVALSSYLRDTSCDLVVLRPPLVYGPNAPGNLKSLIRAIDFGLPLPVKNIDNQRSMIYIGNLISVIISAAINPVSSAQAYVVSDIESTSTADLVSRIAALRGRQIRLSTIPLPVLSSMSRIPYVGASLSRLVDSLVVDSTKVRRDLAWSQPYNFEQALSQSFSI